MGRSRALSIWRRWRSGMHSKFLPSDLKIYYGDAGSAQHAHMHTTYSSVDADGNYIKTKYRNPYFKSIAEVYGGLRAFSFVPPEGIFDDVWLFPPLASMKSVTEEG